VTTEPPPEEFLAAVTEQVGLELAACGCVCDPDVTVDIVPVQVAVPIPLFPPVEVLAAQVNVFHSNACPLFRAAAAGLN